MDRVIVRLLPAVPRPVVQRLSAPYIAGATLDGPTVVDQLDSTVVVPPGWRAEIDEWRNIRMHDTEVAR